MKAGEFVVIYLCVLKQKRFLMTHLTDGPSIKGR